MIVGWSHAGQHAYVAGLGVAIPFVVAAFHTNYAVVGALLSVSAVAGSLLQSLALVVRRTSARVLLLGQNLGSTFGAALSALAPGIAIFMGGRFIQAVTGWPQHPIGSSYLSNRHPERRGTILSWHVTAGNIGTLAAPLAVSAVIASGGWQWGFWLLAIVLATTTVGVALWLPTPWHRLPAVSTQLEPSTPKGSDDLGSLGSFRHQVMQLLRQRSVLALLVAGTIAAGGQGIGILGVYVPAYLHSSLHFSALKLGVVLTVVYIGAVIGPVLMGSIADHVGHRRILLANYALGAVALLAFVAVGKGDIGLGLVGLAMGIFSYSELALRQTLFSDYLSGGLARAGFGIFFTVSQAIGALWVAVIGLVVTDVGFAQAFLTMACTFLAAGIVVLAGTMGSPRQARAST